MLNMACYDAQYGPSIKSFPLSPLRGEYIFMKFKKITFKSL